MIQSLKNFANWRIRIISKSDSTKYLLENCHEMDSKTNFKDLYNDIKKLYELLINVEKKVKL